MVHDHPELVIYIFSLQHKLDLFLKDRIYLGKDPSDCKLYVNNTEPLRSYVKIQSNNISKNEVDDIFVNQPVIPLQVS